MLSKCDLHVQHVVMTPVDQSLCRGSDVAVVGGDLLERILKHATLFFDSGSH